MVIRDDEGQPLLMAGRKLHHCKDAEEAEALACLEGVRMGARWPSKKMILESDNASVIMMLRENSTNRSARAPVLLDVAKEKAYLMSLDFVKIGREQNNLAHELAQRAKKSGESRVWLGDFPVCLVTLACKDLFS